MKLCVVIAHFYPHVGGGEQAELDLLEELVKRDYEVRVITSNSAGVNGHQKYKGIDIYYYDWKILFGHPLPKAKDLEEHIKWADVVESLVYSVVPTTARLCKKLKKPHVCVVHEVLGKKWYWIEPNKIKATLFNVYERYVVNQRADMFVVPSTATLNDLKNANKKCNSKRIFWISEYSLKDNKKMLDKKKYYEYFNITSKDKVFLNYGRPGKTKGIFVYLNAIKMLVDNNDSKSLKNYKFCFIMANDPLTERNKFIKLVNKYGLEDYIRVVESVSRDDLDYYRSCADYIVVPSITEGFGLTAIEACEFKKKVIHSDAGSLPEVTFGSVAQFKNRDSKSLYKILDKVIKGKDVFKTKSKKDFSKDTICSEYDKVFKSLKK